MLQPLQYNVRYWKWATVRVSGPHTDTESDRVGRRIVLSVCSFTHICVCGVALACIVYSGDGRETVELETLEPRFFFGCALQDSKLYLLVEKLTQNATKYSVLLRDRERNAKYKQVTASWPLCQLHISAGICFASRHCAPLCCTPLHQWHPLIPKFEFNAVCACIKYAGCN